MKELKCKNCGGTGFKYGMLPDNRLLFTCNHCGTQYIDEHPEVAVPNDLENGSVTGSMQEASFIVYGLMTVVGSMNEIKICNDPPKYAPSVNNLHVSGSLNKIKVFLQPGATYTVKGSLNSVK